MAGPALAVHRPEHCAQAQGGPQRAPRSFVSSGQEGEAGHTVVAADEAVAVLVGEDAVPVLLRLLHGDVHVAVQAGQDT